MAKIDWTFNGKDTIGVGTTLFSFRLERYKDDSTHEESLKINSLLDGSENGFIVTTIYNLEKDITQLMKYGVVLSAIDFRDLQQEIVNNYLKLKPVPINLGSDSRFTELITSVREYVDGNADLITNVFCYIPVNDFNTLAEDCGFYEYEMKMLRGQLKDKGYIHTAGKRYTTVTRIKNKAVRAIAFKRNKLKISDPVAKDDKQTKVSSSDE